MPEVWAPLLSGAALAIAPLSSGGRISMSKTTLTRAMLTAGFQPLGGACRHLVLTGEPLSTELCRRLSRAGEFVVRNHYGQTEAADTTTVFVAAPTGLAAMPIGRPAMHRQLDLQWYRSVRSGAKVMKAELGRRVPGGESQLCFQRQGRRPVYMRTPTGADVVSAIAKNSPHLLFQIFRL
eukprot:s2180_g2.t1